MISDKDAKRNIAENVNRLLVAREWNQRDLAGATGETPMTISRICRAQTLPGIGILARIAEALDVSIDRLVGAPPKNSRQTA